MSPQMIRPVFDPECRRVFHVDRQGARAHLVALEIWNRATGRDLHGRRLIIYRCLRCGGYHVATRLATTHGKRSGPVPETSSSMTIEPGSPPLL